MSIIGTGGLELRRAQETFDVTPFVRRFVWLESMIRGGWSWSFEFATEDWTDWRRLLLGRDSPGRHFRLTSQEGPGEGSTEWSRAYVDRASLAVDGRAMLARVNGGDLRLEMLQRHRTRAWPATAVSDVFTRLAAEWELEPRIAATTGIRDRWQTRMSDWGYAQKLARTATRSNRGDTYLWLDNGALRFGAPDLGGASERRHDLDSVDNRVGTVVVTFNGRDIDRRGGATLRGIGYDFALGQSVTFEMNAGAASSQPALGRRLARDPTAGLRVVPIIEEPTACVQEQVRGMWGAVSPRSFSLRLEGRPDLGLRPGVVVEVQATLNPRQELPVFGRYVVLEVMHALQGSDIRTTAACYRREAFEGDAEPTGASAAQGGTRDRYQLVDSGQKPRTTLVAEADI